LGPTLSHNNKILHLQYADDTLLFIKAQPNMVERIKWALQVFEEISDLKTNLTKFELISLNLDSFTSSFYVNLLNRPLGKLPIEYLCVKLHWKKIFQT
jgi:hypothetical protein